LVSIIQHKGRNDINITQDFQFTSLFVVTVFLPSQLHASKIANKFSFRITEVVQHSIEIWLEFKKIKINHP
jgi:hypothetical protein